MDDNTIQEKIKRAFIDTLSNQPEFEEAEVLKIDNILAEDKTTANLVEELYEIIGGNSDEDT